MPAEDDITLDEKRVYADKREETSVFVAADMGVARVEVAGDQIGRFSLEYDEPATSIAGADGQLVVGTDSDVLVGTGDGFATTGFGAAAAVGLDDGTPLAVDPTGTVARLEGDEWVTVGSVTGPRRMDGNLLATKDGVVRVAAGCYEMGAGPAVRDVAAAGPYAATADGLFAYDDDWNRVAGGDCTLVASDGERVHAVSEDGLLVARDDEWTVSDLPAESALADLAHGESLYAVTADGTVFVHADPDLSPDGQGGWGSRALGLRNVVGLAVL
jgi:hypothetical protein